MSVRIVNETEYDTKEVRRLVRRALRYIDAASDVTVTVVYRRRSKNDPEARYASGHYREYWFPSKREDQPQIRVSLPRPSVVPGNYNPYPRLRESGVEFEIRDWREALVAVVAHEGMHHRQTPRNGYGRRRGRYVEAECDLAAYRAVGYHREDEARQVSRAGVAG